jgi:hypothetical protein
VRGTPSGSIARLATSRKLEEVRPGFIIFSFKKRLRSLVEDWAGGPTEGRSVKGIFPGASNTVILPEQIDTPLDFDSMRQVRSGLGAGGFAVFDETACMVRAAHLYSRFLWVESCGRVEPRNHARPSVLNRLVNRAVTEREMPRAAASGVSAKHHHRVSGPHCRVAAPVVERGTGELSPPIGDGVVRGSIAEGSRSS